jgi:hypothetical protein
VAAAKALSTVRGQKDAEGGGDQGVPGQQAMAAKAKRVTLPADLSKVPGHGPAYKEALVRLSFQANYNPMASQAGQDDGWRDSSTGVILGSAGMKAALKAVFSSTAQGWGRELDDGRFRVTVGQLATVVFKVCG